jgi:hypothetical protein
MIPPDSFLFDGALKAALAAALENKMLALKRQHHTRSLSLIN